jgi:arsenate reductase
MVFQKTPLFPDLQSYIHRNIRIQIPAGRVSMLDPIAFFLHEKLSEDEPLNLVFICTENSRRSQISQVWASTAAAYYNIEANCYSGGTKVTAFNPRAVKAIDDCGFKISRQRNKNPNYLISFSSSSKPITAYSKLYDEAIAEFDQFTAIMTCSEADVHCPIIPGANGRFPLHYEDPKKFDHTSKEDEAYANTCQMIACEMLYLFRKVAEKKSKNPS